MNAVLKYKTLYLMMMPVIAYFLLFAYYPLVRGFVISLQQFRLIGNRPFVGLDNYRAVVHDKTFWDAFANTLWIGLGILIVGFVVQVVLALSLNEVFQTAFKKITQMVVYLPHLFSWSVVGGMWILLLSPDSGVVNLLLKAFGAAKPINFLGIDTNGRWIMVATAVWKDMGFYCILYLAAIVAINPSLYEAAVIDGANRWQLVRHITVPHLVNTMKVVVMLNVLGILRMFDQIFVMRNGAIAKKVDVLMMYSYQKGIIDFKMGVASAASFLVIAATIVITFAVRYVIRYDEG